MRLTTKICKKCGKEFPYTPEYFYRNGRRGGLKPTCKECSKRGEVRNRPGEKWCRKCHVWKPATEEYYHRRNKDQLQAVCKDCVHKQNKRWYDENRDSRVRYSRQWYNENKQRARDNNKRWMKEHWEERKQKHNQYRHERFQIDPMYRLNHNFRSNVWSSLRERKSGRAWEKLVGYTVEQLMAHLESQFIRGMSWKNYGTSWQVDHKRPIASFSFTSPEDPEFKECWALDNLQPLWSKVNARKKDKWDGQAKFMFSNCKEVG